MPTYTYRDNHYIFPTRIETNRLICKSVVAADLNPHDLYNVHQTSGINDIFTYLPADPHKSLDDAAERLQNNTESFENNERGTYFIYERDNPDTIIGKTGVMVDWDIDEGSWYIWLLEPHQGNGYATELGEAVLHLIFDELDLATCRVYAARDNTASRNAIDKFLVDNGGQQEGILRNYERMSGTLKDAVLYSITQPEWNQ